MSNLTFFLLVARAVDLITTWIYTPDLSREFNPIVRFMRWRWNIILNIVLVVCLPMYSPVWFVIVIIAFSFLASAWNVRNYLRTWK